MVTSGITTPVVLLVLSKLVVGTDVATAGGARWSDHPTARCGGGC